MSSSLKRICQIGRLALAFAALALPGAGISGAQAAAKPALSAAAQMALHFQHEDALYAVKDTSAEPRTPADAMALHFKHEDAIYGGRQELGSARSPAQMLALHFQHEDALYRAQGSASSRARSALPTAASASGGFDWNDALVGAGSAVAVMLLSAGAIVGVRRGRGQLVQP
jgi:hypothetical protein